MLITIIAPLFAGLILALIIGNPIIGKLKKLKIGNTEREELESHQVKSGTPSMGGLIFLIPMTIISLVYLHFYPVITPILLVTLGFAAIGFIDDYLKTIKRNSDGLLAWQKFGLQIIVAALFLAWLWFSGYDMSIRIPFMGTSVDVGWWALPIGMFAVLGTVNGVNFTDGLDGLSSSVTVVVVTFFMLISLELCPEITPIIAAMMGGLFGFLNFNVYPAKVFMGDTGSLAMGGFVIATAYMMQMPLFIVLVGFVYLAEVVSVILQVGYFKLTHGKRLFRMAPIHHHFELGGWSETKVVAVFTILTIMLCVIAFAALNTGLL